MPNKSTSEFLTRN